MSLGIDETRLIQTMMARIVDIEKKMDKMLAQQQGLLQVLTNLHLSNKPDPYPYRTMVGEGHRDFEDGKVGGFHEPRSM